MKVNLIRLLIAFTLIVSIYLPSDNAHLGKVSASATNGSVLSSFSIRSYYDTHSFNFVDTTSVQYLYSVDGITTETGGTLPEKVKWVTLSSFSIRSYYDTHSFNYVDASAKYIYSVDGITTETGNTVPANAKWATIDTFSIRSYYGVNSFEFVSPNGKQYLFSIDGITTQTGSTVPANAKWATLNSFSIRSYYGVNSFEFVSPNGQQYLNYKINSNPDINITTNNQTLSAGGTATLSGTVNDPDGDTVTISATIGGVSKSTIVEGSGNWTLSWSGSQLAQGSYSNIVINADDGKGGTDSATYTGTILVDKTAPTASHILSTSSWTNGNVTITVNATDTGGSGFKRIKKPDGSYQNGTSTSFTVTSNGTYPFVLEDKVGNTSTYNVTISNVDKTNVSITANPISQTTWTTNPINVAVSISDGQSGVSARKYELTTSPTPTGNWTNSSGNSFTVNINSENEWYLHVFGQDVAGNSDTKTFGVYRYFVLNSPSNLQIKNVTTNSLDVSWTQESDQEYYIELRNKNGTAIDNSGWSILSSYSFTNLTPNAKYTAAVKSRKHGKESAFVTVNTYTDAMPVTSASFEPQDKAIKITLNIDETGNDPDTEYIIKNMQTGQESPPVIKEWVNDQLLNDMEYQYAAKVIHKNGKEGEWKLIGLGQTIATKIEPPVDWEDPVGGLDPIDLDNGEFDPDTIEGKVVWFNGKKAIVVKGRTLHLSAKNVQNAKQYSISLTGIGYSDWKDLDETGSFTESIFINEPGFYEVHLKFKNTYGRESQPFVRNYLIDWVNPEVSTTSKIKGQTATTNGSFTVKATGIDNLSQIMYYNGSIWRKFSNNMDISFSVPMNNQRHDVNYKFSDLNGNVVQSTQQVWGINN